MAARRRLRTTLFLLLGLVLPAQAVAAQAAPLARASARSELFLVLPFEPSVRDPRLAWISEGLAELFSTRLAEEGRLVFPRNDWIAALEKLGLPPSTRFTHATMLKVAQQMDADYVLFGQYASDGKRLQLQVRVLQVSPSALSPEFSELGTLEELVQVQARATWHVLRYTDRRYSVSQAAFVQNAPPRRLDTLEQYIRGLSAGEEQRLRNLREAARLDPDWVDPAFALGETYFAASNCEPALIWLSRVPPGHRRGIEAGFESGVCHLWRNDPARAESAFRAVLFALARQNPAAAGPAEIHNNLAIALSRRGQAQQAAESWQRAQQVDGDEPDYWFNAAVGAFRAQQFGNAARLLREALKRDAEDADARALLVAVLEKAGRSTEATAAREECTAENCGASATLLAALREAPEAARRGADRLSRIERIVARLDTNAMLFSGRAAADAESGPQRTREHFEIHLARGRKSLAEGKWEEAQRDFAEAVVLAPDSIESRLALAGVYQLQKRHAEVERELRAALWGRDNAEVRVQLGSLYVARGMNAEARSELRAALRTEPQHPAARKMLDSLGGSGVSPR